MEKLNKIKILSIIKMKLLYLNLILIILIIALSQLKGNFASVSCENNTRTFPSGNLPGIDLY